MIADPYRGLDIEYNHLDLPRKITKDGKDILITYDATGRKWLYETDSLVRLYVGPLTFEHAPDEDYLLEAAATGDGRIVYDKDFEELYPEYHHKDHLGNVRVAFTDRNEDELVEIIGEGNEVGQVMDFYPFGLQQRGEGVFGEMAGADNRYRYNGKELNEDIGLYDYGARWYDPAIGRFTSIDPHSDSYPSLTPYNYVANSPINGIDPDGRDYILLFNHENKTVTVQATYYFERGDDASWDEAVAGTSLWMNQSGEYSYTVGSGDEAVDYTVNFEMTVHEVNDPAAEAARDNAPFDIDGAINSDGGSNAIAVAPDNDPNFVNDNPNQETNGATSGGDFIRIKESRTGTDTGAHEVGHTLGAGHQGSGIMVSSSNGEGRSSDVSRSSVKSIFRNAFKQKRQATGTVRQTGGDARDVSGGKIRKKKK